MKMSTNFFWPLKSPTRPLPIHTTWWFAISSNAYDQFLCSYAPWRAHFSQWCQTPQLEKKSQNGPLSSYQTNNMNSTSHLTKPIPSSKETMLSLPKNSTATSIPYLLSSCTLHLVMKNSHFHHPCRLPLKAPCLHGTSSLHDYADILKKTSQVNRWELEVPLH